MDSQIILKYTHKAKKRPELNLLKTGLKHGITWKLKINIPLDFTLDRRSNKP